VRAVKACKKAVLPLYGEAKRGFAAYCDTACGNWAVVAVAAAFALCAPEWSDGVLWAASLWPALLGTRGYKVRYLASQMVLFYVTLHWLLLPLVVSYAALMHVFIAGGGGVQPRTHTERIDYFVARWPTFLGYGLVPALLSGTRFGAAAALVCGLYYDPASKTKRGERVPDGPAHVVDFLDLL